MDFGLSYTEMLNYDKFGDRLSYLTLWSKGYRSPRTISNHFYKSKQWMSIREDILKRDLGCDLGDIHVPVNGMFIVHHINPLTEEDFFNYNEDKLLNPDNLITTSIETHNKIHYKEKHIELIDRQPGDTTIWR